MQNYKCPKCEWEGTEDEMDSDMYYADGEEFHSSHICPTCQTWRSSVDEYEIVP